MSIKTLGLSVVLGAQLGASYETTLGKAEGRVKEFDQALRELERGRGDIERFRKLKLDARDIEVQLGETQAEVKQLALEMRKAENPAEDLAQRFQAASKRVAELKGELRQQKSVLGQAREEVKRLAGEKRQAAKAAFGLESGFESARKKAAGLKDKLAEQQAELHRLRGQLQGAGLDTGKLEGQYRKLGSTLDSLKAKQERLGRITAEQDQLRGKRSAYKAQILDMVALGATIAAPVRAAMNFETTMAEIGKVIDFKEPDGLEKLGKTLRAMSRRIPLSPDELGQIAAAGGQLGVAAESIPIFTDTVAKMSTAFDMTAEKAGETAAKVANVWGIPIERIGSLGDAINHLSDNTAAKAPEMLDVLQRIGGSARQFGLSVTQAAALGNAFIALGETPERAGTAIKAMLTRLGAADKQGKEFKNSLQELGWSAKEFKAAISQDAQGALNALLESLAKLDPSERGGIITDLVGMNHSGTLSTLVGSLDQYRKAQGLVGKETDYAGSMQREFEKRSETTQNQIKLLGNTIKDLGISIGTTLLPAISGIANGLGRIIGPATNFLERNRGLTATVVGLAAGLATLRIATFAIGFLWTSIKSPALGLKKVLVSLSGETDASASAMGRGAAATRRMGMAQAFAAGKARVLRLAMRGALVATGIGAVLVGLGLLIENWDTVKYAASRAWEGIKVGAKWAWNAIKPFVEWTPLGMILKNWEPISEFFGGFWTRLKDDAAEAWEWIASKIGVVGNAIKKIPFVEKLLGDSKNDVELGATVDRVGREEKRSVLGKSFENLPVGQIVTVAQPSPDAMPASASARAMLREGGVTINYQPTIHITEAGNPAAMRDQVEQALASDRDTLRRMVREELQRLRDEGRRLGYG